MQTRLQHASRQQRSLSPGRLRFPCGTSAQFSLPGRQSPSHWKAALLILKGLRALLREIVAGEPIAESAVSNRGHPLMFKNPIQCCTCSHPQTNEPDAIDPVALSPLISERPKRSAPRTLHVRGRGVTGNGSVHCEVRPPSMIQLQPVIDVADGPNKKAAKSATFPP
jgi:hypothetical protein